MDVFGTADFALAYIPCDSGLLVDAGRRAVISVGRSAALHLDADAPSGLFWRVQTRVSAGFVL